MNKENEVRNFYEVEAQYENTIVKIKDLLNKIVNIDLNLLQEKIKYIEKESEYIEFIDLFNAVIGKKTNKYYFSESDDDIKYYSLEKGKVYKVDELNIDFKSKNKEEKQLNLQARVILANDLLSMIENLKQDLSLNIGKTDGSLISIDTHIIKEKDIEDLDNIINYLGYLIDKTNRLNVLVAEKDVFAKENAQNEYNKKSSIEKWFYKIFNKEQKVINNMTKNNVK